MSHLRLFFAVLAGTLLFVACAPEANGDCTEMLAGPWGANGDAFGMEMTTTATISDCRATFSDWDMAMSVPEGATISGSDVALTGPDWDDCTGTLAGDGMSITGECGDGAGFAMAMQE